MPSKSRKTQPTDRQVKPSLFYDIKAAESTFNVYINPLSARLPQANQQSVNERSNLNLFSHE